MPVELILIVVLVGAGYLFYRDIKKSGKAEQKNETSEEVLKSVKETNNAIIRARADESISDKLRERYGYK
tara:strand:- start:193 stop:402 length:210 start_codon:yes stop_codon:yes gene_type:complete